MRANGLLDMRLIPFINLRRSERAGSEEAPTRNPAMGKPPSLRTIYIFCRAIPENLKLLWDRTVSGAVDQKKLVDDMAAVAAVNRPFPIRPWPSATRQTPVNAPPPSDERDSDPDASDKVGPMVPILKVTGKGIWL